MDTGGYAGEQAQPSIDPMGCEQPEFLPESGADSLVCALGNPTMKSNRKKLEIEHVFLHQNFHACQIVFTSME